jgi:hypothetical protein
VYFNPEAVVTSLFPLMAAGGRALKCGLSPLASGNALS